jgi:hypothetical protein
LHETRFSSRLELNKKVEMRLFLVYFTRSATIDSHKKR